MSDLTQSDLVRPDLTRPDLAPAIAQLDPNPLDIHPMENHHLENPLATATLPEPSGILIEAGQLPSVSACEPCTSGKESSCPPWRVFTSTFITIFLAELGDKTQLSTLLMSAEFHKPWIVFSGAGAALVLTTLLGVWVGQWLSNRLSPRTLDVSAGMMLALIAVWLLWDVVQG